MSVARYSWLSLAVAGPAQDQLLNDFYTYMAGIAGGLTSRDFSAVVAARRGVANKASQSARLLRDLITAGVVEEFEKPIGARKGSKLYRLTATKMRDLGWAQIATKG